MKKEKKIKIIWSCGIRPFCEHRTKFGAWLHILLHQWRLKIKQNK